MTQSAAGSATVVCAPIVGTVTLILVVPGDQVLFTVEFVTAKRSIVKIRGEARVDGQLCAEAEIMSLIQDCGPEEMG